MDKVYLIAILPWIIPFLIAPLFKKLAERRRDLAQLLKERGIIPEFTEVTVFLTSFTFLIFLIFLFFDESFRIMISLYQTELLMIFFFFGLWSIYLSIKYIIPNRMLNKFEKKAVLAFSIFSNLVIGVYTGTYEFYHSRGLLIVFPIFNIVSAILLWVFFDMKIITTEWVSNKQIRFRDLIIGVIIISILFFISHSILKNYWAITFSICLFYATNINEFINKIFFKQRSVINY